VAHASGGERSAAVREVLGASPALEAALGGMIAGQLQTPRTGRPAGRPFNRRYMYRRSTGEHREPLDDHRRAARAPRRRRLPDVAADVSVMHDEHLKGLFEKYWQRAPQLGALERMKLYKLAWT